MLRIQKRLLATAVAVGLWASVAASAATVSTEPMRVVPGLAIVGDGAASTIVREQTGISLTVHTHGLEAGVYTMWLLVWNHPENCQGDGCSPPPAGPDVPDSVVFGGNAVVGPSAKGYLGTRLNLGDASRVIGGAVQDGLTNATGAEIHAVLAFHGPVDDEIADAQFSTPNAGCDGPCPVVQGVPHRAGTDFLSMRLEALKQLLDRVARRNGLRP